MTQSLNLLVKAGSTVHEIKLIWPYEHQPITARLRARVIIFITWYIVVKVTNTGYVDWCEHKNRAFWRNNRQLTVFVMTEKSYPYSEWSNEVSYMDLPMYACVLKQTGGR